MKRFSILLLGFLGACGEPAQTASHIDSGQDSADYTVDAGMEDFDLSSPHIDMGTDQDMVTPVDSYLSTYTLTTGEEFQGEIVASYNTLLWWNPLDGLLYAVFVEAGFAPYPNDQSMRFIQAALIVDEEPVAPTGVKSYRQFLRDQQIIFERPPFDVPAFLITAGEAYHLEEDGYGDFAWDFEVTDDERDRYRGLGLENDDFYVWDKTIYSGVSGEVIEVVTTGEDNKPGSHPAIGSAVNNLVGIKLGGSFYAYYLHFQQDDVDPNIQVGTYVEVGDVLGKVGNSGVSLEPHLHMVLLWFDVESGRSFSVPVEFNDVGVGLSPTGPFGREPFLTPASGTWLTD